MFHLLRANYDRGQPVDKEFLHKTAKLVQEHTQSGAIEDPTAFHALNAKALEAIAKQKQSDTVKVFNLLKALANLVNAKAGGEPYLISIGDRAEEIAQAFESRQITAQQALDSLEQLIAQLKAAEKDRDATGLSPEAFAVFYVLKTGGVEEPLKAAQAVEAAFQQYHANARVFDMVDKPPRRSRRPSSNTRTGKRASTRSRTCDARFTRR
jgi:type I restriction enzyme R subunit